MASRANEELALFLEKHNLEKYLVPILQCNVNTIKQLQDFVNSDLEKFGMNKLEIKRFFREVKKEVKRLKQANKLLKRSGSTKSRESLNLMPRVSVVLFNEETAFKQQTKDIYELKVIFTFLKSISVGEYKTISIESFGNALKNVNIQSANNEFSEVNNKIIFLSFYYLKNGLSFDEILAFWYENQSPGWPRTNDAIFHSIFQQSDPLVRALCIDDYSINFPVPFYYPSLSSITKKDDIAVFKICHELWFSFPECLAIASFGLGRAGCSPVGKSTFLDLIFNTNFFNHNNNKSPFHLNSIDVQISKNVEMVSEEIIIHKVAIFDCHGGKRSEIVDFLAKYVNVLLIHVLQDDYEMISQELDNFSTLSKCVIVLIRDSDKQIHIESKGKIQIVYIPDIKLNDKKTGKFFQGIITELFKEVKRDKVSHSLIENMLRDSKDTSLQEVMDSKGRIDKIVKLIDSIIAEKTSKAAERHFFSFYQIFVKYMISHHKSNHETNQKEMDQFNENCALLDEKLHQCRTSRVIECFFELFESEYSPLLLRILSEYLVSINKEEFTELKYSVDVFWREALLSFKYDQTRTDSEQKAFTSKLQRCLCKQIMNGEPFELIDGDNLVFHSKNIDKLLQEFYEKQKEMNDKYNEGTDIKLSAAPIVISILGAQNSGKSTLLNYLFGCRFLTSSGRCTKGVYGSLFQLEESINNSKTLLILDTEGLSSIERENSRNENLVLFDRTLALFCLAVSNVVIINIVGDINADLKNLLEVCAYSLNRLKVNKVTLPKILFVLNREPDVDVKKHASSLNELMKSLKSPIYTSSTEVIRVSDLIRISDTDLKILPCAFNSTMIYSPFHTVKPVKNEITENFLTKCADLKDKIFEILHNYGSILKPPFENLSGWIQMAGNIWEICIKYQDIVMYRGLEEIAFSQKLSNIQYQLIEKEICQKQPFLLNKLETVLSSIEKKYFLDSADLFNDNFPLFKETFDSFANKCRNNFKKQAENLPDYGQFDTTYKRATSNLEQIIYSILKGYEDKMKFRIKIIIVEQKLAKSMKKFKNIIELKLDDYINISIEEKLEEFKKGWEHCYETDQEDELSIKEEYFASLYSNFKIECNYIEARQTILASFKSDEFDMNKIIEKMEEKILYGLKNFLPDQPEDWYFCTIGQYSGDFTRIQPHNTRDRCMYLRPNSLIKSKENKLTLKINREIFCEWIPKEWHPLIKSCSGDHNFYEIVWGDCPERIQILRLASTLRNPQDPNESCWDTLLSEVRTKAQSLLEKDKRDLSQTTIKLLIKILKESTRVVNHEIKYIRAMLSDRAERSLSTLLFSYAFKEFLSYQKEQIKLNESSREAKKEELKEYFLQKIETREMFKDKWDNEKMKRHDIEISKTFALSYTEAVKRFVISRMQIKVEENFERQKESMAVENLLSLAEAEIEKNLKDLEDEIIDPKHFVIQFICNRNAVLEELFLKLFGEFEKEINEQIRSDAKTIFSECITPLEQKLLSLENYFDKLDEVKRDPNCLYSNYNFVLDETSLEIHSIISKEVQYIAMSIYLQKYLDPEITSKKLSEFFKSDFEIEGIKGIKVGRSDKYLLPEEKFGDVISTEEFKRLESTDIFSKELIFNIYSFIVNFRNILRTEAERFSLESDFILQLFKEFRNKYLKDALGCDMRCPSCGKFCDRRIHNDGSKCQINSGHQFSSMGGKVWKNDLAHTAVLFMCDDYQNSMTVKLPGKSMKWEDFKFSCGSEWIWEAPDASKKEEQKVRMQKIWKKFGKGILKYYSNQGTNITYIPISLIEMKSISTKYFICFLIDGTGSMSQDIKRARLSVSKLAKAYQNKADSTSSFKVVIYRDHCDKDIIETYPNEPDFSNSTYDIERFLNKVVPKGGGDEPEAMLDGLAVAVCKTNWLNDAHTRNIIVHIFDSPPHGNFPNYKQHRRNSYKSNCCCCNRGLCPYDWDEHVWNPIKKRNIFYHGINTSERYVEFEKTMKAKLGELCGDFQLCGKEQVDVAVLQIFIDFHI